MTLLGPTGCGKGATVEIPNLLMDGTKGVNVISIDSDRAECLCDTTVARHLFRCASSSILTSLHDLKDIGCNPLLSVHDADGAMRLAEAVEEVQPSARMIRFGRGVRRALSAAQSGHCAEAARAQRKPRRCRRSTRSFGQPASKDSRPSWHRMGIANWRACSALTHRNQGQTNRTIDGIKMHAHNAMKWLLSDPIRKSLSVKKGEGIDWTLLTKGPRPLTVYVTLGD